MTCKSESMILYPFFINKHCLGMCSCREKFFTEELLNFGLAALKYRFTFFHKRLPSFSIVVAIKDGPDLSFQRV